MPKYRSGKWSGIISYLRGSRVSAGLFLALRENIEREEKINFEIDDRRKLPEYLPLRNVDLPGLEQRSYQWDAVRAMRSGGGGGLILNATGTGKTLIAGLYFRFLKGSAVFVADELTLMYQAQEELARIIGEPVGVVGESRFEPQRVSVATIQTLHRCGAPGFRKWAAGLQVMIIDELHLALNKRQRKVVQQFKPRAVYGLTATLELQQAGVRMDAYSICGGVLYRYGYQTALTEKVLTPGVVIAVDPDRDLTSQMEYPDLYRERIVHDLRRNDLLEALVREALRRGRNVVLLLERIQHLKILSERLCDVPHEVVFGERKVADRIDAKRQFDSGELHLLIANKVFKKGINLRKIDCIVDGASMASGNDAVQKYGRGVRLAEAKTGLIHLDVGEAQGKNAFYRAALSRRRALRAIGVPVVRIRAEAGAGKVFDLAEAALALALRKLAVTPEMKPVTTSALTASA
jgi:superfamily II DNA or RNA helicase